MYILVDNKNTGYRMLASLLTFTTPFYTYSFKWYINLFSTFSLSSGNCATSSFSFDIFFSSVSSSEKTKKRYKKLIANHNQYNMKTKK